MQFLLMSVRSAALAGPQFRECTTLAACWFRAAMDRGGIAHRILQCANRPHGAEWTQVEVAVLFGCSRRCHLRVFASQRNLQVPDPRLLPGSVVRGHLRCDSTC